MNKLIIAGTMLIFAAGSVKAAAYMPYVRGAAEAIELKPYGEIEAGAIGLGALQGTSIGYRVGLIYGAWDGSAGYSRDMGNLNSPKVEANGATVNTLSVELYRTIAKNKYIELSFGGGIGYSIIDLDGRDKADPDVSYEVGAAAKYKLSKNWEFNLSIKSLFLRTHVRRIDHASHTEMVFSGGSPIGEVEIDDQIPRAESLNLNSGKALLALIYRFGQ